MSTSLLWISFRDLRSSGKRGHVLGFPLRWGISSLTSAGIPAICFSQSPTSLSRHSGNNVTIMLANRTRRPPNRTTTPPSTMTASMLTRGSLLSSTATSNRPNRPIDLKPAYRDRHRARTQGSLAQPPISSAAIITVRRKRLSQKIAAVSD